MPVRAAVLALFCTIALLPGLCAAGLQGFPPIVAAWGKEVIFLNDIAPRLLPAIADLDPEKDRLKVEKLFKAAVEQQVFMKILLRELSGKGIAVDRNTALSYIDRHCRRFGADGEELKKQLSALALNRDFQFKAAMHTYFERFFPEQVAVSDGEIEQFYRLNQKRFLAPAKVNAGVIVITKTLSDARNRAADAAARLRQGEDFTAVAGEYNPEGSANVLSPELVGQVKNPVKGRIYEVEDQKHYAVILIREFDSGSYQPLAKAAPVIAEELAAARMSRAMQRLLTAEVAKQPVKYSGNLPLFRKTGETKP